MVQCKVGCMIRILRFQVIAVIMHSLQDQGWYMLVAQQVVHMQMPSHNTPPRIATMLHEDCPASAAMMVAVLFLS